MAATATSLSSGDSEALFVDTFIKKMDFTGCSFVKNGQSYPSAGPGLTARPLCRSDYSRGYLNLMAGLTKVGNYSKEIFEAQFEAMKRQIGAYYIVVIQDSSAKLVASATLLIEHKFIHGAALRGRIEDVVVDKDYRGSRLGLYLLELLTQLGKHLGCYKLTLDCKPGLEEFYKKCGYSNEGQLFLTKRFRE